MAKNNLTISSTNRHDKGAVVQNCRAFKHHKHLPKALPFGISGQLKSLVLEE